MNALRIFFLVLLVSPLFVRNVYAATTCSVWLLQSNGTEWRQCVRDDGSVFCQSKNNGQISTVSCSK